jgi:methionyl-tRNA synthetase
VWFDALLNYVTAAGYLQDEARFARQWAGALHLMAKDILTTHSVYWPTMLHAAGLPMPRVIFAHGYWTVGGMKMGKSLGNAVRPLDLADVYGADAFRYFLLRDMTPGQDADFNAVRVGARYQADLANNLGNLLQRVTNMTVRYCGGRVPDPGENCLTAEEQSLRAQIEALPGQVFAHIERFTVNAALAEAVDALTAINTYLERTAPWLRARDSDADRVAAILYTAGEALRLVSVLLSPVLPESTVELWRRLGWQPPVNLSEGLQWGGWQPGSLVSQGEPLFPRVQ